jgi:hypothetical protein
MTRHRASPLFQGLHFAHRPWMLALLTWRAIEVSVHRAKLTHDRTRCHVLADGLACGCFGNGFCVFI